VLILVTGHRGYVGSVLVAELVAAGHTVRGLDVGFFTADGAGTPSGVIEERPVDIRDVQAADVEGCDAVVHLAALSNDPLGEIDPRLTEDVNVEGSSRVAAAAQAAGVRRFVCASSCSVYGFVDQGLVGESGALGPRTAYSRSKVEMERRISALAGDGLEPVFLRFGTAYGLSPSFRSDVVLNDLVGSGMSTGEVVLASDGSAWRPMVHVRDMASAIVSALEAPAARVAGHAINIGGEDGNHRVLDIARAVQAALGGVPIAVGPASAVDHRSYQVDFSTARRLLPEFTPRWDVERGAAEIRAAFETSELSVDRYRAGDYVRVGALRRLLDGGDLDADLRWSRPTAPSDARARGGSRADA
jgi:nucleoside-diphosphate-sugar epimerase